MVRLLTVVVLLTAHALAGIELHTTHFRMFAQGVIGPGQEGVALGMRAAF